MEQKITVNTESSLENVIIYETDTDPFQKVIYNLARYAPIDSVLKLASSPQRVSTAAWVNGLKLNPRKPKLYCVDASPVRVDGLQQLVEKEALGTYLWGASVSLNQFSTVQEVEHFSRTEHFDPQMDPLDQILGRLKQETDILRTENVPTGRIREMQRLRGGAPFGAVLIDGSEFTGSADLEEVYGADFILLNDTRSYKCHRAREVLFHDPGYELLEDNQEWRNGFSVFRRRRRTLLDPLPIDAPIHFFTIVLNGEPFIRYHIEVLQRLGFRWHWHIVEGLADLTNDTAWSVAAGGNVPEGLRVRGRSNDGTAEYLEVLASRFPEKITVYRKPAGQLWNGKVEMVAQPLTHIFEDAILFQIDSDELWTVSQLEKVRCLFLASPEKAAMWFWCHFFVGPELAVSSRNCYSQNPKQEWLRAWNFSPGMRWQTHEPPVLGERKWKGTWVNVAGRRDFTHDETQAAGLVFQHFAYATEAQLSFKEHYYGYKGALASWRKLQLTTELPIQLSEMFPWVKDGTTVDSIRTLGITPLAKQTETGEWMFADPSLTSEGVGAQARKTIIVIDGVFFQLAQSGIARVWLEALKIWSNQELGKQIYLLDRDETAPQIPGIKIKTIPRYEPERSLEETFLLQQICDELEADLFVSTYYTTPVSTPSALMIYDMIPELLRIQNDNWQWREKRICLFQAARIVCISDSTARDTKRLYPEIDERKISVVQLAAPPGYGPQTVEDIEDFRKRLGIEKEYLLVVGERTGIYLSNQSYKNAGLVFRAWSLLAPETRKQVAIFCVGGQSEIEKEFLALAPEAEVHLARLSDEDLQLAYAGAIALVYPSLYEGFGLPVIEAMACACPVITCRNSSLAEVAGEAALYVDPWDARKVVEATELLRADSAFRAEKIKQGLEQASRFSYERMAAKLGEVLWQAAQIKAPANLLLPAVRREAIQIQNQYRESLEKRLILQSQNQRWIAEIQEARARLKQRNEALHRERTKMAQLKAKYKANSKRKIQKPVSKWRRFWRRIRGKKTD